MAKLGKQNLWQAISCLLCLAVTWIHLDDLGASEFSGGRVTGVLFILADYGSFLFLLALFLTFLFRRIAAAIALAASLLCLPLFLYFAAPCPFRRIFKGEYSVARRASFVWNTWAIAGIFGIAVAIFVCLRAFSAVQPKNVSEGGERRTR